MNKWKCTVCKFIMDVDEKPSKCVHCKADSHKIRALYKLPKKAREMMD